MKQFTVTITKCADCPYARIPKPDLFGWCEYGHPNIKGALECDQAYQDNKDGLTPSCPMWRHAIEVDE